MNIVKQHIWMKKNQTDARKVMNLNSKVWNKHGWQSGSDVVNDVLKKEIKKKFGTKKFDPVVSEILEDANYHSVNQALQDTGSVKYKGNRLKKYMKLGGKTWDL